MSTENENLEYDVDKLRFYFDSIERDRIDNYGLTRRSGEVLALRQKLLSLPEAQFEAAMKTISKLVDENTDEKSKEAKETERKRRNALELFNRTTDLANDKNAKADKISRV